MVGTVTAAPWTFDFMVQVQTDSHLMPIEDATVKWPESLSPYVTVARLHLPAQRFTSDEQLAFADGLRYIRQAQQLDRGAWRDGLVGSIDHPLHPLGLVMVRGLVGGEGPDSWQHAAVALSCETPRPLAGGGPAQESSPV